MKKLTWIIALTLQCLFALAQQNYKIDYTFTDRDNHSCKSTLFIVKNESVFKVYDSREFGIDEKKSTETDVLVVYNDPTSKIFYSTDKNSIVRLPLYKSEIVYSDLNNKLKYKLTGKKKKIGKYDCQEATFTLNERKYSVWFTPEVNINFGPYKINGIPGLIAELTEETNKVRITLNSIKKLTDTKEFEGYKKFITGKTVLDYKSYEKKIIDVMTSKKAKGIAKVKEMGGSMRYDEDQNAFTRVLVDVPAKLVAELQKIN